MLHEILKSHHLSYLVQSFILFSMWHLQLDVHFSITPPSLTLFPPKVWMLHPASVLHYSCGIAALTFLQLQVIPAALEDIAYGTAHVFRKTTGGLGLLFCSVTFDLLCCYRITFLIYLFLFQSLPVKQIYPYCCLSLTCMFPYLHTQTGQKNELHHTSLLMILLPPAVCRHTAGMMMGSLYFP